MTVLAKQLRALLDAANRSTVPSGVLVWFGLTSFPDGIATPPPVLGSASWSAMYLRLSNGDVGAGLPTLSSLTAGAAQPGEDVPLVIASIDFSRPTPTALAACNLAAAAGGTQAAISDSLPDNLESSHVFAASVLLADQFGRPAPTIRGRSFRLTLADEHVITNAGPLADITVDTGDGSGPRPLAIGCGLDLVIGERIAALTLLVAATVAGRRVTAVCNVVVSDDPAPPATDETIGLPSTAPGVAVGGTAFVFRAHGSTGDRLHRPVVIAEGFPGGFAAQYLYEQLNQFGLVERWRSDGRDVVRVGFDAGTAKIQDNAKVMREAIEAIAARTDDPLVVGGVSMGGLISRYALAEMEHDGVDHRTSTYLSIDAPHGSGAYTSFSTQWFCDRFAQISPAMSSGHAVLVTPANQQFVGVCVQGDTAAETDLRREFLRDLRTIGWYPCRPRLLAVASGRGTGAVGVSPPTDPVLTWTTKGWGDVTLRAPISGTPTVIGSGSSLALPDVGPRSLTVESDVCWEVAPGALNNYNAQVSGIVRSLGCGTVTSTLDVSCSIPTVSSLDLDTHPYDPVPPPGSGHSPFDDYAFAETDQHHVVLTEALVEWILDRIDQPTEQTCRPEREAMTAP